MNVWTLDHTSSAHPRRSIVGTAAGPAAARRAALRAVAAINAAPGFDRPHYTVAVDGHLAAIIHTGLDADGLPDHRGVAALLQRLTLDDAALTGEQ